MNMALTTSRQHSKSFADTNLNMLESDFLCDVTFAAGNEQQLIKCHKFILASRSPVFHAMFCGPLAESSDVIYVPDIEPSTFEDLLRYVYTGNVSIKADTVMSVLYAAKKYDVRGLESKCKSFLIDNMDSENVCIILDQSVVFNDEDLKDTSLEFIMDQYENVLNSRAFVRMSKLGLGEVLKLKTFNTKQYELYFACKRWVTEIYSEAGIHVTNEHIRQELGDELISLINFPALTLDECADIVYSENRDSELGVESKKMSHNALTDNETYTCVLL
ncbi:BTB/POZ domain-containing protein 3-like [Dreissena polymorpha]|uniref:BTB domain-containing protein n=1 Tax=Dreissena polymorpha TaxID=45954 RepID=A0A9D4F847_DREPO|nr:BTB/POZ domain-containing protein 3-like [Dreissena polymorpha]KAH3792673.1 hypothetical protein DPMN_146172 [Dreissena polymorpha]